MTELASWASAAGSDVCPGCGLSDRFSDRSQGCFTCWHWADQFATPGGLIIGGNHYRVLEEPPGEKWAFYPEMYGSYGRGYRIRRLADGVEIVTHNLWHQGEIPPRLARPDTAVFVPGSVPPPAVRHRHADHLKYVGQYKFDAFSYMCRFNDCGYFFATEAAAAKRDHEVAILLGVTR